MIISESESNGGQMIKTVKYLIYSANAERSSSRQKEQTL